MKLVNDYKTIGWGYRNYDKCRFFQHSVFPVINLGNVPLAGGFIKKNENKNIRDEKFYPLELFFCPECYQAKAEANYAIRL
ncbi:MAG: hypothetical protein HYW63_03760 [Candidatus Levybacteria bacterium]|nr:hypothetical protein [Candidatus Levybacteria bacterium]